MKEREAMVLKQIVTDYVHTGAPIGSKQIASKLGVSSATVRNDMRALIDDGYIEQPHTSSGRIPADMGYRFFVDCLMNEFMLAEAEKQAVDESLNQIQFKLDQIFSRVATLLSEWCGCISFVFVPDENQSEIMRLELSPVSANGLLIIVVLRNGMVENRLALLPTTVDRLPLKWIARELNDRLSGMKVCDINQSVLESVFSEIRLREDALHRSLASFFEELLHSVGTRVYLDGQTNLFSYPEFSSSRDLRPVLEFVESARGEPVFFKLPEGLRDMSVVIGREIEHDELFGCSLLKSRFRFSDRTPGTIGLIGPKRMDYPRLINIIRRVSDSISGMLSRFPNY